MSEELKEKIKLFVAKHSYLDVVDDEEEDELVFGTRENGDVGNEEPGAEDWNEVMCMISKLKEEFPNQITCSAETIDEWCHLNVRIL